MSRNILSCARRLAATFFGLLLCIPIAAQNTEEYPTFKVDVDLMYVAVEAKGPSGKSLEGLNVGDFEIKQNGVAVTVRGMEIQDVGISTQQPVTLSLVICNKGCIPEHDLRKIALAVLDLLKKPDVAELYTTSPKPEKLSDFTDDFDRLKKLAEEIKIERSAESQIYETLFPAAHDLVKFNSKNQKILALVAGDSVAMDNDKLDELKSLLVNGSIKFWEIGSITGGKQHELATKTNGRSSYVYTIPSGEGDEGGTGNLEQLAEDWGILRTKRTPVTMYLLAFTPTGSFDPTDPRSAIEVSLGPHFGVTGKNYFLTVYKPFIRKKN